MRLCGFLAMAAAALCLASAPAVSGPLSTEEIVKKWGGSVVSITLLGEKDAEVAKGSGFVVGPELVATCYHVVAGGISAQVKTADKITYPVTGVVAFDRTRDLALLKVRKLSDVPPVELGESSSIKGGERVVAIGNSLGLEGSISDGVASGIREVGKFGPVVQVSAPISHGNSGGPLFDSDGKVIGVVSFTRVDGQNVNFGISVGSLRELIRQSHTQTSELNSLKPDEEKLLTQYGVLPNRRVTMTTRVPQKPPYSIALPAHHDYELKTLTVRTDKKPLERAAGESELGPGKYFVSELGALHFDAAEKERKVIIESDCRVYRTAVFIEHDPTYDDFVAVLQDRLSRAGDQIVIGAEVEAGMNRVRQQGLQMRDLARLLNCGRLIVASGNSSMSEYNRYQYRVNMGVKLTIYDLSTGRVLSDRNSSYWGIQGKLQRGGKIRRSLAESCIDEILGPVK